MLDKIKAKRHAKVHKKFGTASEAVHKHEEHMHPGKKLTKLKDGGVMGEKKSHDRLDKLKRGGKAGTKVSVIIAPQGTPPQGAAPMRPPIAPPMGAPLPAASPVPPMKKGGSCYKLGGSVGGGMTAGAVSGEGRLQKIALHKRSKGKK